jgi:peroxiredoxin
LPAYEADLARFEEVDAQVLGITVDSVDSNMAWVRSLGVEGVPVLSDYWPHGQVAQSFGVLREQGMTERAIFIVDKQGVIRYIDIHDFGRQPDNEELFEVLREINR